MKTLTTKTRTDSLNIYLKALNITLTDYLAIKTNPANLAQQLQVKFALQYGIEFVRLLLDTIKPHSFFISTNRLSLQEKGVSNLLGNSEPDCENVSNDETYRNELYFYQDVAQNIKNDPLKEYHDHLLTSLSIYKPSAYFSVSTLFIGYWLWHEHAKVNSYELNKNIYFIAFGMIMSVISAVNLERSQTLNNELSSSQDAFKNLLFFMQQTNFTLPGIMHNERVENINEWFENRNLFFPNKSLSEIVNDNATKLASGPSNT